MSTWNRNACRLLRVLPAALLLAFVSVLEAQPATAPGNPRVAESTGKAASDVYSTLAADGLQAFEQGRVMEARQLFERAHRLQPSARTLRALGLCAMALDRYTQARAELAGALADRRNPLTTEQETEVKGWLEWMSKSLGIVRLRWFPPHANVEVDGERVDRSTSDLWLTEGKHQVRVSALGYIAQSQWFDVSRAKTRDLVLKLVREPMQLSDQERAPRTGDQLENSIRKPIAYVVAGLGVAALITGGVLGLMNNHKAGQIEDACPNIRACDPSNRSRVEKLIDEAKPLAIGANVAFIAGAAAIATGVTLWLTAPSPAAGEARLAVQPAPGGLGLQLLVKR